MIKKFEEFVLECYDNPLNEAFQSSKLREIIKKHGKPKYGSDYKILYDIKDKYIIDIIDSPFLSDEQKEEYESKNTGKKIREINLEDDTTIVLALTNEEDDLLYPRKRKSPYGGDAYFIGSRNSYAEERHKGNLGKSGAYDNIHHKHIDNVIKIEKRRLAEKLHSSIPKIIDEVKSIISDIEIEDDNVNDYIESEITLNGEKYTLIVNYEGYFSEKSRKGGVADCETSITIIDFDILAEDGTVVTNEDLGITEKTHKDLFKEHIFDSDYIYDEAEAVGIDDSYFISR